VAFWKSSTIMVEPLRWVAQKMTAGWLNVIGNAFYL
jgi:hypothetical protein